MDENRAIRANPVYRALVADGRIVDSVELNERVDGRQAVVLEHPPVPFWSYPYEWSFALLRAAAVAHLDVAIRLFGAGIVLRDASAYNIQFLGVRPIFIDALSFRWYRQREHWLGSRQFHEQFLYPLLLQACTGVPFQALYRGSSEGITVETLYSLLPLRHRAGLRTFLAVTLPRFVQRRLLKRLPERSVQALSRGLSHSRHEAQLVAARDWIRGLVPCARSSMWSGYDRAHRYDGAQLASKRVVVHAFVSKRSPRLVLDLGCNSGDYAELAISAGAKRVIGVDADPEVLNRAFDLATRRSLDFLPLYQDLLDPSPAQGWDHVEHRSFFARCESADAVLALAVLHHFVLGRNLPLERVVSRIVALAPHGLIEFVPKDDPMVRSMMALREDVFSDYHRGVFEMVLGARARIVNVTCIPDSGRALYEFDASCVSPSTSSEISMNL